MKFNQIVILSGSIKCIYTHFETGKKNEHLQSFLLSFKARTNKFYIFETERILSVHYFLDQNNLITFPLMLMEWPDVALMYWKWNEPEMNTKIII
jgi:hypothetical protein